MKVSIGFLFLLFQRARRVSIKKKMCTLPEISNYIGGNLYAIPLNVSNLADSRTKSSNYSNVVSSTRICTTTEEDSCSWSFEKGRQHDAYPRSIKMHTTCTIEGNYKLLLQLRQRPGWRQLANFQSNTISLKLETGWRLQNLAGPVT